MAAWIAELPVQVLYGHEVTGFAQDDDGRRCPRWPTARSLRAQYLVGCDGGRSVVRRGGRHRLPRLGGDAQQPDRRGAADRGAAVGRPPHRGRRARPAPDGGRADGPGGHHRAADRRSAGRAHPRGPQRGADRGVRHRLRRAPTRRWISRFTDATRQAAAYRAGRVLLAGDAAHVHYPAGGQGLSLGVQDAVNLGWKLAQVVRGASPPSLLDTYHDERHPVGARALRHTMAQTALQRGDDRTLALIEVVSGLAAMDEPRRRLAGIVSGLDIQYDLGEGHPLLGRRMPDLDLGHGRRAGSGVRRCFTTPGRCCSTCGVGTRAQRSVAWGDRVRSVRARYDGPWELPVLGAVTRPARRADPARRLRRLGRTRGRRRPARGAATDGPGAGTDATGAATQAA